MLRHLRSLRIPGLAETFLAQEEGAVDYADIPFEDRFKEMVDAAWHLRSDKRTARLLSEAALPMPNAAFEEVDYCPERSFDIRTFRSLQSNGYIDNGFQAAPAQARPI